jgi:Lrp/AsnC family transcriptional regulator, leucine-responsive regulatory protein
METVESSGLDPIDREIVGALVRNARLSYRELGEHVSLSANATAERVRRLRERGVIAGFRAIIDPAAAGRTLVALIDVRLGSPSDAERFERLIESQDAVTDTAHVTGRFDYQVRAVCQGTDDLDAMINQMKTDGGVVETDTRIALRTVVRRPAPLTAPSSA